MKKLIFSMIFVITSSFAHGRCENSEYIDLRSGQNSAFSKIPVKNQGQYGLCYAYAASTMVEFFKIKAGLGTGAISPLEAGISSSIVNQNESEVGGDICDVVNTLSQKGSACTDTIVGKESRFSELSSWFHYEIVTQVFLKYVQQLETFKSVSAAKFTSRTALSPGQETYLTRFDSFYLQFKKEMLRRQFTLKEIPASKEVFLSAQKIHVDNNYAVLGATMVQMILNKICHVRSIAIPSLTCKTSKGTPDQVMSDIDSQISIKKPVGISYCSYMLNNKGYQGLNYGSTLKKNCAPHASVIIGRKSDSVGGCQYLIRNSWGEKATYNWPSSAGDIWVTERALQGNVFQVHKVQKNQ